MFGKTSLCMGYFSADLSTAGEVVIAPPTARPTIGGLAAMTYKRATLRYTIENPGAYEGILKLKAAGEELPQYGTETSLIVGSDTRSAEIEVDLATVEGQTRLEIVVDVQTPGSATAKVWAALDIEYTIPTSC